MTTRLLSLVIVVVTLAMSPSLRSVLVTEPFIPPAVAAGSDTTATAANAVVAPQGGLEHDVNRGGSDYRSFEMSQPDPTLCQKECENDATCRAFTYVKPGVQGPTARCWLKNAVPDASANTCCVSGVKSSGSTNSGLEVNINRRGGDYRHYDLPSNNPNQCRDDCANDSRCKSFTYLRPSYWGPNAHCFLKDSVPAATEESCCISGVKAGGGGGGGGGSAEAISGRWDFVCCSNRYKGEMSVEPKGGNRFEGWFYQVDHRIEGEINGNTVKFIRRFSGGSQQFTMTLSQDGRTMSGSFTGAKDNSVGTETYATRK